MVKLTKRKGFNFFRSYYDVYNELQTAEDKVAFIDALLDRQFLGIKPTNLQGMAKFAYISQTNSIDSQVKGYEDKTGIILTPCQGGAVGGADTPCLQVQEKEKEKVKDNKPHLADEAIDFKALLDAYNKLTGKSAKVVNDKTKRQIKARFKEGYTKDDLWEAMINCSKDPFHIEKKYNHFTLEFISRADKLDKYLTAKPIKENLKINDRL